jgi:multidrug efflux pump subunit AcrB
LGSGTSKLVATVMSLIGQYSDGLWFFILIVSIPLAVLGSLTEFWMAGEWYGIPKLKGRSLRRKPTEKMGI